MEEIGMIERTPTLCEINYNPLESGVSFVNDEFYTPYRYRSLRTFSPEYRDKYRENIHTSASFYEPVTLGRRTPPYPSNFPVPVARSCRPNTGPAARPTTTVSFYGKHTLSSRHSQANTTPRVQKQRKQRAKTAPIPHVREGPLTKQLLNNNSASLHAFYDTENEEEDKEEKVKWVPALNTWITESQNPVPYLNFCNAANLADRGISHDWEQDMEEERRRRMDKAELARLARIEAARLKAAKSAPIHRPRPKMRFERPKPTPLKPPVSKPKAPSPEDSGVEMEPEPEPPKKNIIPIYDTVIKEEAPKPKPAPKKIPPPKPKPPPAPPPPPIRQPTPPPPPPPPPSKKVEPPPTVLKPSTKSKKKVTIQEPPKDDKKSPAPNKTKDKHLRELKAPITDIPTPALKKPEPEIVIQEPVTAMEEVSISTFEPEPSPEPTPVPEINEPIRKPIQKKDRWRAEHQSNAKLPPAKLPDLPDFSKRRTGDWIYGDEDFSTEDMESERQKQKRPEIAPLPTLVREASSRGGRREGTLIEEQPVPEKPRWGKKKLDSSLRDKLERERLAEERRAKAAKMLEKLRQNNVGDDLDNVLDPAYLEDYGWLAKYCILPHYLAEAFGKTFEIVDDEQIGWLNPMDTILALRAANTHLTTAQEEFVFRVLHIAGYDISKGADVKLFSILAALSQKIVALDDWMKNLIQRMDFKMLEMKLFMSRTLWECSVDPYTNTISINQLCVELRAGGVSIEHELEVRHCLKHKDSLDLLDFLTYIPLFIMIHTSVVDNPLNDTRDK